MVGNAVPRLRIIQPKRQRNQDHDSAGVHGTFNPNGLIAKTRDVAPPLNGTFNPNDNQKTRDQRWCPVNGTSKPKRINQPACAPLNGTFNPNALGS